MTEKYKKYANFNFALTMFLHYLIKLKATQNSQLLHAVRSVEPVARKLFNVPFPILFQFVTKILLRKYITFPHVLSKKLSLKVNI